MTAGTLFSPTSSLTPESPTLEDGAAHGHMKDAHLTNFLFNQRKNKKKLFTVLGQKKLPTMLGHFTVHEVFMKRPKNSSLTNKSDLNTEQEN